MIVEVSEIEESLSSNVTYIPRKNTRTILACIRDFQSERSDRSELVDPMTMIDNRLDDEISNGRNYLFNDNYNPFIYQKICKDVGCVCLADNVDKCKQCKQRARAMEENKELSNRKSLEEKFIGRNGECEVTASQSQRAVLTTGSPETKEEEVNELRQTVTGQEQTIVGLRQTVEEQQKTIADQQSKIEELNRQNNLQENRVEELTR